MFTACSTALKWPKKKNQCSFKQLINFGAKKSAIKTHLALYVYATIMFEWVSLLTQWGRFLLRHTVDKHLTTDEYLCCFLTINLFVFLFNCQVLLVWLAARPPAVGGLKSTWTASGVRCATLTGQIETPVWSAGSWAWGKKKERNVRCCSDVSEPYWWFYFDSDIGTALQHSQFGSGSGLFHYERLGCHGDENTLSTCRSRTFVTGDCNHGNEAAVVCAPPEGQCDFQIVMATRPE